MSKSVIVIGGGPAGIMAAGTAASLGANVFLIEKNKILGKKLLITGKGRCNITNYCDVEDVIKNVNSSNPKFLYSSLNEFNCYDTYSFFESMGVPLKIERGNRVFPVSDRAADIRNSLRKYIDNYKVKVVHECVTDIDFDSKFVYTDLNKYKSDAIIIATGGLSYPSTGSTGDGYKLAKKSQHDIVSLSPSLVALQGEHDLCYSLAGLSLKNIAIKIVDNNNNVCYTDFGEMLFTHDGVSGPVILSASSKIDFSKYKYNLYIDFKPALSENELDERLLRDFKRYSNKDFINSLDDLLPKKLIPQVVNKSGINPRIKVNSITKDMRTKLVDVIKSFKVNLIAKCGFDHAIITSGGVSTFCINPKTMESLVVKGIYFAGEVIDIDANTGGYNLQLALATGYVAGKYSSRS